ncbi:MAG: hypothetical protein NVSMB14_10420 [Isosphaeraceae bacterium]
MRLGATCRGALALLGLLVCASGPASAGLFHKAIPRETAGIDLTTGQQMYAPPIPSGHYATAKVGYVHEKIGMVKGSVGGLFHHGNACNSCGGRGCAFCSGTGIAHGAVVGGSGGSGTCADCGGQAGGGHFHGRGHGGGFGNGFHHGGSQGGGVTYTTGRATVIEGQTLGTPQTSMCNSCGGRGCGLCKGFGRRHGGGFGNGACGNCGGAGCGLCGNRGFGNGACGNCGGAGCGLCGKLGFGKGKCGNCGGAGCGLCGGSGLLSGVHGKIGTLKGILLGKLTHAGQIKYFVGPGGPVPITPGYVPYVNVTRSPRDYFAFPPFVDNVP